MSDNLQNQQDDNYTQMLPDYGNYQQYSELDYRVGFGRRLGAYLLDFIILFVIQQILYLIVGVQGGYKPQPGEFDFGMMVEAMKPTMIYSSLVALVYMSLEVFVGASLGKLILGIRIASDNRHIASYGKLATRYIAKNISSICMLMFAITINAFFYIGILLGFVIFFGCFAVLGSQKKALHDYIAKTAVYYKEDIINQ